MKNTIFRLRKYLCLFVASVLLPLLCFSDQEDVNLSSNSDKIKTKSLEVKPRLQDEEIGVRLANIFQATERFIDVKVIVRGGVVFLEGEARDQQCKEWAGDIASNIESVTTVINKIIVKESSGLHLHKISTELIQLWYSFVRALPRALFGCGILFITWMLSRLVCKFMSLIFRNKKASSSLLYEVIARGVSFLVFLFGVYFVFKMANLTTMAWTVISGTGVMGIIIGIAFKDITENFLASILLSVQSPFHVGDLIDIVSPATGYVVTGYVERLTLRVTILVSLEGSHLQIPNATVYKSNIRNFSTNPCRREDFVISVEANSSISKAMDSALKVLVSDKAILKNPEPLVLVDSATKDLVNLRIYYWIDIRKSNWLKVKSSVIRLIKQSFCMEDISGSKGSSHSTVSEEVKTLLNSKKQ